MESPIIPLGDKIVILPQEEGEQTYGNIVVPDMGKEKPLGYYSDLEHAILKVSRMSLANAKEEYTLAGFIESFNNIKNKLTKTIKN